MKLALISAGVLPNPWRRPLAIWFVAVLLLLVMYRDTAWAIVQIWERSETYAHAFVVPPISLWLTWRLRGQLAGLQARPAPACALLMAVLALGWELGSMAQVAALQHFMLVGMLVASVPLMLGWATARALMFPLGFLFFAVPFGDFLTPWLINNTADFTVAAIRLTGIPVFREGNQFVIPSGRWSVVEACSGIRYLMASLMVGTLFAYLNYRSLRRRWAFIGVAILTPIVANWLRAYLIVMIGHLSDNRLATGVDHLVYGWVFFGIVIVLMFMLGGRWTDAAYPPAAPASACAELKQVDAHRLLMTIALLGLVVGGIRIGSDAWLLRGDLSLSRSGRVDRPIEWARGWTLDEAASPAPPLPLFKGATSEVLQALTGSGGQVWVHVAHYAQQDSERKLVSSANGPVSSRSPDWHLISTGIQRAGLPAPLPAVRVYRLASTAGGGGSSSPRWLAWQFYWIGDRPVQGDAQAKLDQIWWQLQGRGSAGTAVTVYAQDLGDGQAQKQLETFLERNFAPMSAWLLALAG